MTALIATVTFAAGFTLLGGYNDNDGMTILTKKAAFKAFVVADTIAVTLSVSPAFVYFPILSHRNEELIGEHLTTEAFLTMFGMGAYTLCYHFPLGFQSLLVSSVASFSLHFILYLDNLEKLLGNSGTLCFQFYSWANSRSWGAVRMPFLPALEIIFF